MKKKKKILFISSGGGHLSEMMRLSSMFEKYEYYIMTEKTKTTEWLKKKYKGKVSYLLYATKKEFYIYPLVLLINSFISLFMFIKERPKVIITTGTHTAGPMCYIGKILGAKIIFIETYANRTTKTVTGKLIYPIADLFLVQWEDMLKLYPKAKYWGCVY